MSKSKLVSLAVVSCNGASSSSEKPLIIYSVQAVVGGFEDGSTKVFCPKICPGGQCARQYNLSNLQERENADSQRHLLPPCFYIVGSTH